MIRLAVAGAAGRMGKTILSLAARDRDFRIVAGLEHPASPEVGKDLGSLIGVKPLGVCVESQAQAALENADVLIDFSEPHAAAAHLKAALRSRTAYVLGTTGLSKGLLRALRWAARSIPIVQSPNMSAGVHVLFRLAEAACRGLGEAFDIEIVEAHHRMKKDAPSGTALRLLEILQKARGPSSKGTSVYGRKGLTGARPPREIGVFAIRGGDVVGDHTVSFLGDGERLELIHRATSREAFARGALGAAKFVVRKKRGFYNMRDVLGLT